MSSFTVNTHSLEAIQEALLVCAAELNNAEFSAGPGRRPADCPEGVLDSINGAWPDLRQVLMAYSGVLQGSGHSIENIATVLKTAIAFYTRTDQNLANAAGGTRT